MRDSNLKDAMCHKYLKERGFKNGVFEPNDLKLLEEFKTIQLAFSQGWDEAQKWEVSEAQREGIAVQAMVGLLSGSNGTLSKQDVAKYSYAMADEMIRARKC